MVRRKSFGQQVRTALSAAPPVLRTHNTDPTVTTHYDALSVPDDFPIRINYRRQQIPPNYIPANDLAELREIYRQFCDIKQIPRPTLEEEVVHEGQHGEATLRLGARAVRYGLEVKMHNPEQNLVGWAIEARPERLSTIQIGSALISIYPDVPSDPDMASVRVLGYRDEQDVVTRAVACGLFVPPRFELNKQ